MNIDITKMGKNYKYLWRLRILILLEIKINRKLNIY